MTDQSRGNSATLQRVSIIFLLLVLVAIQAWPVATPPKWTYMIASPTDEKFEEEMQALGSQGWELVSARRATTGSGESAKAAYEMIFKRPTLLGSATR